MGSQRRSPAAPPRLPAHLSGIFNDYTPPAPTVSGGPYEMHGKWSLAIERGTRHRHFRPRKCRWRRADFANTDVNHDPTKLGPHTHHVTVSDGVIHSDATDPINWMTSCPVFKPPVAHGFVIKGTAYVTGNGGSPPVWQSIDGDDLRSGRGREPSTTTVQTIVQYSNFTLTFDAGSKASTHFGTQAINGVVARCDDPWNRESKDCKLDVVE